MSGGEITNGCKGPARPERYTYFHLSETGIGFDLFGPNGEVQFKNSTKGSGQDFLLNPSSEKGVVGTTPSDEHIPFYGSLAYPMRTPRVWYRPEDKDGPAKVVYVVSGDPTSGSNWNHVVYDREVFHERSMISELIAAAAIHEYKDPDTGDLIEILWVISWAYPPPSLLLGSMYPASGYKLTQYNVKTKEVVSSFSGGIDPFVASDPIAKSEPPLLTVHPDGSHAAFIYVPRYKNPTITGTQIEGTWSGVYDLEGPIKYKKIYWDGSIEEFTPEGAPVAQGSGSGSTTYHQSDTTTPVTKELGLVLFPQFDPVTGSDIESVGGVEATLSGSGSSPLMMEYLEDGSLAFVTIEGTHKTTAKGEGRAFIHGIGITCGGPIDDHTVGSEGKGEGNKSISDSYKYDSTGSIKIKLWDGVVVELSSSKYSYENTINGVASSSADWAVTGPHGVPLQRPPGGAMAHEEITHRYLHSYDYTYKTVVHLSVKSKFAVLLAIRSVAPEWEVQDSSSTNDLRDSYYEGTYTVSHKFGSVRTVGWLEIYSGGDVYKGPEVVIPEETHDAVTSGGTSSSSGWSGIDPSSNGTWIRYGNSSGSFASGSNSYIWTIRSSLSSLPLAAPNQTFLTIYAGDLYFLSNWTHSAAVGGVSLAGSVLFSGRFASSARYQGSGVPYPVAARGLLNYQYPWKAWVKTVGNSADPSSPPKATEGQVSSEISHPFNDFQRVAFVRPVTT